MSQVLPVPKPNLTDKTSLYDLIQMVAGCFLMKVQCVVPTTGKIQLEHAPILPGPVIAQNMMLTKTLCQAEEEGGHDYWVDYECGVICWNCKNLPEQVVVSYKHDPARWAIIQALLDVSRKLTRVCKVNIKIMAGICEYPLPHDFVCPIELDCNGQNCPSYSCSEGCNGYKFACGKLTFHLPPKFTAVCCLTYGGGFLPDEDGMVDLPVGFEQAVFLKAMALMAGLPNVQLTGDNKSTPAGALIERTYKIGDETVTRKWDKGSNLIGLCQKYNKMYNELIAELKPIMGVKGGDLTENYGYHGLHCNDGSGRNKDWRY